MVSPFFLIGFGLKGYAEEKKPIAYGKR